MKRYLLLIVVVLIEQMSGFTQSFQVIDGIPRLPVYANTGSVASPANGMLIYSTADLKPMVYNGSSWSDLCTNSLTATTENYFVVKGGIPYIPAKTTVGGTPTAGAMYYSTTDNAIMVYNGTTWEKLRLIGNSSFSTSSGFSTNTTLKVFQIPVQASAPTGAAGAIYINSGTKKFNYYNGSWTALSCSVTCGDDLVKVHTFGDGVTAGIAGDVYTITYKTVSSNLAGPNSSTYKCWIIQNLGASSQASDATDATSSSRGWFWQFNRKQGHKNTGTEGTTENIPMFSYADPINEALDWQTANDPCALLLGTGWRIPTSTEWTYADGASGGNWSTAASTYSSVLKLHMAGYIWVNIGMAQQPITNTGQRGVYSSSTRYSSTLPYYLQTQVGTSAIASAYNKFFGYSIRCLKE